MAIISSPSLRLSDADKTTRKVETLDRHSIAIMAFPRRGDAYTTCFNNALESLGVVVSDGMFSGRWLLANLRGIDYIHLHFPSFFYSVRKPSRCIYNFALFLFLLALARRRGTGVIWTVHNLYPHDRCIIPALDKLARRILIKAGCRFLVHGPSAAAIVEATFGNLDGRMIIIDHGHWIGYYPNSTTRSEARKKLGLDDHNYVFLFLGLCKPYKNLETLIRAFRHLPPSAVLLIAGKFPDPAYEATIRTLIEGSGARIILHSGYVPDETVQLYCQACDMTALPYLEILTSGTALLSFSFGRPVIAPAMGHLKDIVTTECGILYDPLASDGLSKAMESAMSTAFDSGNILARAEAYDWRKSAQTMLDHLPRRDLDTCQAGSD